MNAMMVILDPNVPTEFLRDYYKTGGSVCLACGDDSIDGSYVKKNSDGNYIVRVNCRNCKSIWVETHSMSHIKMEVNTLTRSSE